MTAELQAELVGHKPEIMAYLKHSKKSDDGSLQPITPPVRPGKIPLSFAQQRLWFVDQLQPGSSAYNMFYAVRLLNGKISVDALRQGFHKLIQRHESLRTTFESVDGQPYQVIAVEAKADLPLIDLTGQPDREKEAERLAREEAGRPFDLAKGPLVRCTLIRLADEEHILLLTMHHIISDRWSLMTLLKEMVALEQGHAAGREFQLPALPFQYADFALWQRDWLQGETLDEMLGYWKGQLQGIPLVLDLPTDLPRPAVQTSRGGHMPLKISVPVREALQALGRREDATLFMLLLAGFQVLLSRYTGQTHILVGSPVANRNRPELEGLIGCFANTLVLHGDLTGDPDFHIFLQKIRAACLGAYEHQDMPFEMLVDELQVQRDLSRNPIFQAMFILQNIPVTATGLSSLRVQSLDILPAIAQFDLTLSLQETPNGLEGHFEYNTDLFAPETISLLSELYRQILTNWIDHPDQRLSTIQLPAALAARVETARARDRRQAIHITATFTAEPVKETLAFWMEKLGQPTDIEFAPYSQVFQELLDPASLFAQNQDGFNVVLLRWEDWLRDNPAAPPEELLERNLADIQQALLSHSEHARVPSLVLVCPASPNEARLALYQKLEEQLSSSLSAAANIYLVPSADLEKNYPVAEYYDPHTDKLGHIPYTPAMYTAIGTQLARKINALRMAPYKVIVLDCDNTLWQGVCAEDGAQGVHIDGPYRALQGFMRDQQMAGKLLCLCSKNDEADVWEVFAQHPGMLLKRDDFVAWRINWQPKSENLRSLADELQLGLDSFIFIDDSPLECAEVSANCPEVLVFELPADPEHTLQALEHHWAFDQLKVTHEDQRRTRMYQENLARQHLQNESLTFESFLAQLELQIDIHPPEPAQIGRLSQLTQRTNQFNTTTLRRSEAEVSALESRVVDVLDRFGDYGLVGAMFYTAEQNALKVDNLLLSCRALGRGVEEHMLAWLGSEARLRGLATVEVLFAPSAKNQPAFDFLQKIGGQYQQATGSGSIFRYPVDVLENLNGTVLAAQTPLHEEKLVRTNVTRENRRNAAAGDLSQAARELSSVDEIIQAVQAYQPTKKRKQSVPYKPAHTPTEKTLVEIWEQVLKVQPVGIDDNFFDIGGDSLSSMRVLARAHQAGLHFTPQDLFKYQSIAELAKHGGVLLQTAEQAIFTDPFPLTISQRGFFAAQPQNPNRWNYASLIEIPAETNPQSIEQIVRYLWLYHDALRARFVQTPTGWMQAITPSDANTDVPFTSIDFSELPKDRLTESIERTADEIQAQLNIQTGPLMRVAFFNLGPDRPGRLLFVLHHLVYDMSSSVFFDDFFTLSQQLQRGESLQLPPKTTPIWQWVERLDAYMRSDELHQELDYWLALPWQDIHPIPVDLPENRDKNLWGSVHSFPMRLGTEESNVLLSEIPKAYAVQVSDILTAALAQTIAKWSGARHSLFTTVDLGRNALPNAADLDLSRTVGWFSMSDQLVLESDPACHPLEMVKSIQTQLQKIPKRGIGFEVLLRGSPDQSVTEKLRALPASEIMFNYTGHQLRETRFTGAYEYSGPMYDAQNRRLFLLDCSVSVLNGQLVTSWRYSKNLHTLATIKKLAEAYVGWLQRLVAGYKTEAIRARQK